MAGNAGMSVVDQLGSLRRVAELITRGAGRTAVLDAIVAETYTLFPVEFTAMLSYEAGGAASIVAVHHGPPALAVGERAPYIPEGLVLRVFASGRRARVESYDDLPSPGVARMRELGISAGAAAPILVGGSLWGVLVAMTRSGPVAPGLEHDLAEFAEIAATAVAGAQATHERQELADEQAALRRVAELAARGAGPREVFERLTAETSALLPGAVTAVVRLGADNRPAGAVVRLGAGGGPVGAVDRLGLDGSPADIDSSGEDLADRVRRTGRPARTPGAVAVPLHVEGRVWGMLTATSRQGRLSDDTERRLSQFAGLAAAAIANAENRAHLTASRARVVATADETRRRLQRDVHDGAQQRLVQTVLNLKIVRDALARGERPVREVSEALYHAERANAELRDLVHGILPAALTRGGLRTGLESLIGDLDIPVTLRTTVPRLPAPTEITVYFFVAEALTNVVKHARATRADVTVALDGAVLTAEVGDDGIGGADPARGSGLTGLSDRIQAAEGTLTVTSAAGGGTVVRAVLPLSEMDR